MIALMERLRARGLRAAILYGGEPTLRPEICQAAGEIFDATLAFTNGTNGFPELRNGQWILSLDGPREMNDELRGSGVYDAALAHLREAFRPPIVHMTLSRQNRHTLETFVPEMLRLPIKGIGFSFYTPNRGQPEPDLFIPLPERDQVIGTLVDLHRRYGDRVGFTAAMGRQLHSRGAFTQWNRRESCPVYERVWCFQANGDRKPCTYGARADCSRCGCAAVTAYRGAFKPFDPETFRIILGLMVPSFRPRRAPGNGHPQSAYDPSEETTRAFSITTGVSGTSR
jgi:MoaA/NifB/PqqE/SkfB family radical SAM enzyme